MDSTRKQKIQSQSLSCLNGYSILIKFRMNYEHLRKSTILTKLTRIEHCKNLKVHCNTNIKIKQHSFEYKDLGEHL